jgi:RecA-family ATPase
MTAPPINFETPAPDANGAGVPPGLGDPWTPLVLPASADWFTKAPPPRTWLLRDARAGNAGVLPLGTVGQVIAEGGAGKTMLLAQLAVAVATGTRWLGALDVTTPGRVLLCLGEEDADEVRRRLYRACRAADAPVPPAGSIVTLPLRGVACALVESDVNGNPCGTAFGTWLRAYVATQGPWTLVAVDPLSRFAGLDAETDNAAGTRYVQALEGLAVCGPAVLGSHHTNKLARGPGGKVEPYSGRGSSSLVDGPRWVATLARERLDHGDADVNARLGRIVTLTPGSKSNVSREAAPIVLRYDGNNGGALVPLDDADHELVQAARRGDVTQAATTSQKEARTRQQDAADDAAARALLDANPGASVRTLTAILRKQLACGGTRAHAAVVRVRRGVP